MGIVNAAHRNYVILKSAPFNTEISKLMFSYMG